MQNNSLVTDLANYGINQPQEVFYNPDYDLLFQHETNPLLQGYERGFLTNTGSIAVDTGIFTGRSPKDKYVVKEEGSEKNIWWTNETTKNDNRPIDKKTWDHLKSISVNQLSGKKLYVVDCFCGANPDTRINVRFIMEVAWQAHFVKNMFIRPSENELGSFKPDFIVFNASKTNNPDWKSLGMNSEVFIAFNLADRMAVIGGSWYGGEMKKGIFTVMNYFLPLKGIASMHCSANMGSNGDTAIFFGLSGTGKTTLSADPKRALIGDDEHGWDHNGVFNFEGGCYAKTINLNPEKEPDIFHAIRRDALLENVVFDEKTGAIDFASASKTENTRVSYPIYHIQNIVTPVSRGGHPNKVVFLTADAFGVLPPVSKLTPDQTKYHFLSGFTAKLAGTERGICEPQPTFSACFGAAFLMLHPTVYAHELVRKMEENGSTASLVNTGWFGGAYGSGKRMDLNLTRKIIDSILEGTLDKAEYDLLPIFNLQVPKAIAGISENLLNPRNAWPNPLDWDKAAINLAERFIKNFTKFTDNEEGKRLIAAGPVIK